eukprot:s4013_g3.t1
MALRRWLVGRRRRFSASRRTKGIPQSDSHEKLGTQRILAHACVTCLLVEWPKQMSGPKNHGSSQTHVACSQVLCRVMQPQVMQAQPQINVAVNVGGPAMVSGQPPQYPPGPWQASLFGCCANPIKAIFYCFCPCVVTFEMIERAAPFELVGLGLEVKKEFALPYTLAMYLIGGGTAGTVLFILSIMIFMGIKAKYRITESLPVTLVKAVCCICCFQVQILRHADAVEGLVGAPVGVYGSLDAKAPMSISRGPKQLLEVLPPSCRRKGKQELDTTTLGLG